MSKVIALKTLWVDSLLALSLSIIYLKVNSDFTITKVLRASIGYVTLFSGIFTLLKVS
jgi:hypothetical protein